MNTSEQQPGPFKAEILIVEDSHTQAEQLRTILEENGYRVRQTRNGKEAAERLGQERPALVVSDVLMPEMDGYALCHWIKEQTRLQDLPVILLTALSDPADVIRGLECGADSFIFKPYEKENLLRRIEFVLANQQIRSGQRMRAALEVKFRDRAFIITSDRVQMLNLLLASYEAADQQNQALAKIQTELREISASLEQTVQEQAQQLEKERQQNRSDYSAADLAQELGARLTASKQELDLKNRALDAIASSLSHDFRVPLETVAGFANTLRDGYQERLPLVAERYLETIQHSIGQLNDFTHGLLRFARLAQQPVQKTTVQMNQLVSQVFTELRLPPERRIEIILDDLPPCHGDPALLKEVLFEVVSNAVKFTRDCDQPTIRVGSNRRNSQADYFVADNGTGFDPGASEKLFGLFQRFHGPEYEGSGVGLAIVQLAIERHGGQTWTEGALDGGATFYFTIPKQQNWRTDL